MVSQAVFSLFLSIAIFVLAFNLEVGKMGLASNLNAIMIVLGGTLSATLFAYPAKKLVWTGQLLRKAFGVRNEIDWTINTIITLAHTYRKGGMRALEEHGNKLPQGLLKSAVELMTYHHNRDKIEQVIQKEAQLIYSQYETSHKILHSMARLAPALGLTGTIINLIRIFGRINSDPQSLIGYMAIALLSTFYGVVLANLCFVPLSNKLKEFMDQEEIRFDLIQEGILDLYDKENPRAIKHKLETLATAVATPTRTIPRPRLIPIPPKKQTYSVMP
jgi:chemotaxis protein MotA